MAKAAKRAKKAATRKRRANAPPDSTAAAPAAGAVAGTTLTLNARVEHFSSITLTNTAVTSDILGDAYEVLIKRSPRSPTRRPASSIPRGRSSGSWPRS